MSRQPSILSVSSSAPAVGNGQINFADRQDLAPSKRPGNHRSMSLSKLRNIDDSNADLDPDELFTKCTVSEVKFVQQRLRADADAKQEELRLMVGERYRDLLQASTSIISIARSSQRVKQALEETKGAILSQEEPPLPQKPPLNGGNDAHLHTLQLLSVHIKLLLDAPEHLWRLLERKKYFPAAWLFLLARVVHRALVRDDEQEDGTWSSQGIDVLEQFPLVQRQWDAVSQFRSQITYKATVSLREYSASTEDTCAALLTLHLLDSRPLTETISVLLGQRSKTLHTMLSWKYDTEPLNSPRSPPATNGHTPEHHNATSDFRKKPVKEVREATCAALSAISQTLKAARGIFQDDDSQHPLIRRVLEYIQSDSPGLPENSEPLPPELYLTTQTLLTTLPSSTHFLLLPSNLKSYKPYVDLNSSSSSIHYSQFAQELDDWFRHSANLLQIAIERWFSDLQSIKEVWSVRISIQKWISCSGLAKQEITHLMNVLNHLCRSRVIAIWKVRLTTTLESFRGRLNSTMSSLNHASVAQQKEKSPVDFLYQTPPLPVVSQAGFKPVDVSFQKYTASLRRQLVGRTSLLDGVLNTLEICARTIQQDLSHVMIGGHEARILVEQLTQTYRPEADALCIDVIDVLESAAEGYADGSDFAVDSAVFLSRIADELSNLSPFVSDIGCDHSIEQEFRQKSMAAHDQIIDRWRKHTVSHIVNDHRLMFRPMHPAFAKSTTPSGPSSDLVRSLLLLSSSIQQLGIPRDQSRQSILVQTTLRLFITGLVNDAWKATGVQSLYDLVFLGKLADAHGWGDLCLVLDDKIKEQVKPGIPQSDLKSSASESLARMQTLLATLLPPPPPSPLSDSTDKFAALLPYGIPTPDQQYHSAIELVKPSSRFGMLLVGGS